MRLGVGDCVFAATDVPLAPGRDDRKIRRERGVGQLETNLIVSLSRASVRQRVGADAPCDLDLAARDERPGHRRAEEVLTIVDRSGAERREDERLDEFLAQVFDVAGVGARRERLGAHPAKLVAPLPDVGGHADDLGAGVMLLEPRDDNGSIESAGVREDDGSGH